MHLLLLDITRCFRSYASLCFVDCSVEELLQGELIVVAVFVCHGLTRRPGRSLTARSHLFYALVSFYQAIDDMSDGGRLIGAAASGLFSRARAGYAALAAPGQPQTAVDTIDKLNDRLANGEHMEERKAALLGIKGLSRDWKAVRSVVSADGLALGLTRTHRKSAPQSCRRYSLSSRGTPPPTRSWPRRCSRPSTCCAR